MTGHMVLMSGRLHPYSSAHLFMEAETPTNVKCLSFSLSLTYTGHTSTKQKQPACPLYTSCHQPETSQFSSVTLLWYINRCIFSFLRYRLVVFMSFISMGCILSKHNEEKPTLKEFELLASETSFGVNEVEALYNLFKKISSSVINDGLIHKEEFHLALFRNSQETNLFSNRVFDAFDIKDTGVIEFGEFIRSLSVFHPNAPVADKARFAFNLYDLRHTGYIEWEELKEMVLALLQESDIRLSDDSVEAIVDKTFTEADLKGDGKIDPDEWKEYVDKYPAMLRNMTLPYLKDITTAFPSFALNTAVEESEISH